MRNHTQLEEPHEACLQLMTPVIKIHTSDP
jgi:hypothetical protein